MQIENYHNTLIPAAISDVEFTNSNGLPISLYADNLKLERMQFGRRVKFPMMEPRMFYSTTESMQYIAMDGNVKKCGGKEKI